MKSLSSLVLALKNKDKKAAYRTTSHEGNSFPREVNGPDMVSYLPESQKPRSRVVARHSIRAASSGRTSESSLRNSRSVPALRKGYVERELQTRASVQSEGETLLGRQWTRGTSRAPSNATKHPLACSLQVDVNRGRHTPEHDINDTSAIKVEVAGVDDFRDHIRSLIPVSLPDESPLIERPVIPTIILSENEEDLHRSRCTIASSDVQHARVSEDEHHLNFLDFDSGSDTGDEDAWGIENELESIETDYTQIQRVEPQNRHPLTGTPLAFPVETNGPSKKTRDPNRVLLEMFPEPPPLFKSSMRRPSTSPGKPPAFGTQRLSSKARPSTSGLYQPSSLWKSISVEHLGSEQGYGMMSIQNTARPWVELANSHYDSDESGEMTRTPTTSRNSMWSTLSHRNSNGLASTMTSVASVSSNKRDCSSREWDNLSSLIFTRPEAGDRRRFSMLSTSECGSIRLGVAV